MVQRIETSTVCDKHARSNKDVSGLSWTVTITPPDGPSVTRQVDACETCGKPLRSALDFIRQWGTSVPKATNGRRRH